MFFVPNTSDNIINGDVSIGECSKNVVDNDVLRRCLLMVCFCSLSLLLSVVCRGCLVVVLLFLYNYTKYCYVQYVQLLTN